MNNPKKPVEPPVDPPTPSVPTPEMIEARREAQEEKQQAAVDWERYKADENYRKQLDEQQRLAREMEAQYQSHQRERKRDEPDR